MNSSKPSLRIALTIAGSDSGGGAGIQADLKTFHAFGVFGTSVVTAITAQNTLGVQAVHPVPVDVVHAQIRSLAGDLRPGAFKTGMLATGALVELVADAILDERLPRYVLDPVMISTSGHRLLDDDARRTIDALGAHRVLWSLATLAVVMYLSRSVDWYGMAGGNGASRRPGNAPPAPL